MTVRKFIFMKRKAGISWPDFSAHWRGPHAVILAGIPVFWDEYTETYIQNHVRPRAIARFPTPTWDGVVEVVQREREDSTTDFRDHEAYLTRVLPDEANFLSRELAVSMFAKSDVVLDGPRRGVKLLILIRRHSSLTSDQFQAYWRAEHGEKTLRDPGFSRLKRYVQHYVLPDTIRTTTDHLGYDGIGEFWFDSTEALEATYAQPSYDAEHLVDLRRFVANPPSPGLLIEEVEVVKP